MTMMYLIRSSGRSGVVVVGDAHAVTTATARPSRASARRRMPSRRRRAERRAAPALEHRELRHRLSPEPCDPLDGAPERHERRDGDVARNAEQRLELRLLRDRERGDGAGEAFAARGEQDVPGEGIDRRAADDADAVEEL